MARQYETSSTYSKTIPLGLALPTALLKIHLICFGFVPSIILWEQLSLLSKWWITHFGIKHFNWSLMWSQWFWSCNLHQMIVIWWRSQDGNILILLQADGCVWIIWNEEKKTVTEQPRRIQLEHSVHLKRTLLCFTQSVFAIKVNRVNLSGLIK